MDSEGEMTWRTAETLSRLDMEDDDGREDDGKWGAETDLKQGLAYQKVQVVCAHGWPDGDTPPRPAHSNWESQRLLP